MSCKNDYSHRYIIKSTSWQCKCKLQHDHHMNTHLDHSLLFTHRSSCLFFHLIAGHLRASRKFDCNEGLPMYAPNTALHDCNKVEDVGQAIQDGETYKSFEN